MRFMILVKATADSEAGRWPAKAESEKLFSDMAAYHEELSRAGMLLDASGLWPSSKGWRIHYSGTKRTVIDGPFPETKELVAGYTLIQAKSREDVIEWTKRFPQPHLTECEIEVRQLYELEDLEDVGPSEQINRFREIGVGAEK